MAASLTGLRGLELQFQPLPPQLNFIFIYLAALGLSCGMQTLSHGLWDLVSCLEVKPRLPTLGAESLSTGPPENSPVPAFKSKKLHAAISGKELITAKDL